MFFKAIRSLRIWPIRGTNAHYLTKAVEEFLDKALCMQKNDLEQVIIEDIRRVHSAPRSKQHDEVCIVFREPDTRELILSYTRNLATYVDELSNPSAGIRMEIPHHLLMNHKLLTMYGYNLRTRHEEDCEILHD